MAFLETLVVEHLNLSLRYKCAKIFEGKRHPKRRPKPKGKPGPKALPELKGKPEPKAKYLKPKDYIKQSKEDN